MPQPTPGKTIYIANMCDHCYGLAAALRSQGSAAEVLPPPDDESLAIGLALCRGRECSPCLVSVGDIVRLLRQPGIDPARTRVLMPTAGGSCRLGYYEALLRQILNELGYGQVEMLTPTAGNSYQDLGDDPRRLRILVWQAVVAIDVLQKLLHAYRPYERDAGQTDQVYQACLEDVVAATEQGGRGMVAAMRRAAGRFAHLAVDRSRPRPVIGLLGEIYLRHNRASNLDLIRRIEALGGEVYLATMMEWFYYTNWRYRANMARLHRPLAWAGMTITDQYQRQIERRVVAPVAHLLPHAYETPAAQVVARTQRYYHPDLGGESILTIGKSLELAELGLSGVINAMPFACMPGVISAGMAPRLRADMDNLPWLDIAFDAQGGTNITTRLQAFMHQAAERHARRGGQAH